MEDYKMKLAKRISTMALASIMVITAMPTGVMAQESVNIEIKSPEQAEGTDYDNQSDLIVENDVEEPETEIEIELADVSFSEKEVAFGTSEEEAIALLPTVITKEGKEVGTISDWSITEYNGEIPGEYQAQGSVSLHSGYIDENDDAQTAKISVKVLNATAKQLEAKVASIHQEYPAANYTAHSYQMIQEALEEAAAATKPEAYTQAILALNAAIDKAEELVTIEALVTLVNKVEAAKFVESDYTKASWKAYAAAKKAADEWLTTAQLSTVSIGQEKIDTAKDNLNKAAYGVKESDESEEIDGGLISIVELTQLVEDHKDVVVNKGDYSTVGTTLNDFLASYALAEKVIAHENPEEADTVHEVKALTAKIKELAGKLVKVDGTTLRALVAKAEDIIEHHKDYYKEDTNWENLLAKKEKAEAALMTGVDLETAITELDDALQKIEKVEAIATAYEALESAVDVAIDEIVKDDFIFDKEYVEAVKAGQALLKTPYPTEEALKSAKALVDKYNVPATASVLRSYYKEVVAKKYDETYYTEASYQALTDALETAANTYKTITNKEITGSEELSDEHNNIEKRAIKSAYLGIVEGEEKLEAVRVDKTKLTELVEEVKDYSEHNFVTDEESAWGLFVSALENAQNILKATNATQNSVEAAYKNLKEAVAQLVTVDRATLEAKIAEAEKLIESDYAAAGWVTFENALEAAKEAVESEKAEVIKKAQMDLEAAMAGLTTQINRESLKETYEENSTIQEKDYTTPSFKAFKEAMEAAKPVVELSEADYAKVPYSRLQQLEKAIIVAKNNLNPVNFTELKALVAKANEKVEKDYTVESWENFVRALNAAQTVVDKIGTVSEIRAAQSNLEEAMLALVKAEIVAIEGEGLVEIPDMISQQIYVLDGWVAANGEIEQIKVNIDGAYIGDAAIYDRAGLNEALPQYAMAKGAALAIDTYNFKDGEYTITLTVVDKNGTSFTTQEQSFYINNPIGTIDTPFANTTVSDDLILVSGWFGSEDGIEKVEVLLGEEVIGQAYTYERAGLAEVLEGRYNVSNGGFAMNIAKANLGAGAYTITVRATTVKGATVARNVTFTIA